MRVLPLHTNPFDLGAHVEDEHDIEPMIIEMMDSDELRRMHEIIHRNYPQRHRHYWPSEGD